MKKILALLFCLLPSIASAQIVGTLPFQLQNGTTADATQVMADFNKILTDTNANAAHSGVNSDITALTALITPITPTAGGSSVYTASISTGTANAQVVSSPIPTGFVLGIGRRITFIAGFTNTGAMTLSVNGTAATNVFKPTPSGPVALVGGEVVIGNYIEAVYDGTQYQLYTDSVKQSFGPLTNLASAATTDIGTIGSHNVNITGVVGITSFGSTAVTGWPIYKLKFAGILSIANSASLLLPNGQGITTAAGDTAEVEYLGAGNWSMRSYTRSSGAANVSTNLLQNYISGLTLSAAGGTGTFGVNVGTATDSTNSVSMVLSSAFSKTTASWSVGTAAGALDTGAIAINTWYHVFLMQRSDTGVVDVCVSLSASACTTGGAIPAAYNLFRRIGSMRTNASSQWLAFAQLGDTFLWASGNNDISSTNPGTAAVLFTLLVPSGVQVVALFDALAFDGSGTVGQYLFTSPDESDQAPSPSVFTFRGIGTTMSGGNGQLQVRTNASSQVRFRADHSTANVQVAGFTQGWIDARGKR